MKYTKEIINAMRTASYLIEPPASEVIGGLLDEIERLQSLNRWIPVSERLPEEKDCPVDSNGKIIPFVVGCINGTLYGLIHLDHFVDNKHYTHWQSIRPLPVPPEEG